MAVEFFSYKLVGLSQLVRFHGTLVTTFCILNLVFCLVASLRNLIVIRALWKVTSIPPTIRKLFLSLAFSDLAVGLLAQSMYGVIIAVMLRMAANGNYSFDFLCPIIVIACFFIMFVLGCASFLNVTAVARDRLLALSLHLRYQELVTSKRVIVALVCLWLTSAVAVSIFIFLLHSNRMVVAIMGFVGLFLTTVAYIRVYRVLRYHQNQIQGQLQLHGQAMELHREKKSTFNSVLCILFLSPVIFQICAL